MVKFLLLPQNHLSLCSGREGLLVLPFWGGFPRGASNSKSSFAVKIWSDGTNAPCREGKLLLCRAGLAEQETDLWVAPSSQVWRRMSEFLHLCCGNSSVSLIRPCVLSIGLQGILVPGWHS